MGPMGCVFRSGHLFAFYLDSLLLGEELIYRWCFQTAFFFPSLPGEKIPILTNIFHMGWNHQPVMKQFNCFIFSNCFVQDWNWTILRCWVVDQSVHHSVMCVTPPKINMSPEKGPNFKESSFSNNQFSADILVFRVLFHLDLMSIVKHVEKHLTRLPDGASSSQEKSHPTSPNVPNHPKPSKQRLHPWKLTEWYPKKKTFLQLQQIEVPPRTRRSPVLGSVGIWAQRFGSPWVFVAWWLLHQQRDAWKYGVEISLHSSTPKAKIGEFWGHYVP